MPKHPQALVNEAGTSVNGLLNGKGAPVTGTPFSLAKKLIIST